MLRNCLFATLTLALLGGAARGAPADEGGAGRILIRAAKIYTGSGGGGAVLSPGSMLIENGKVVAVGTDLEAPMGAELLAELVARGGSAITVMPGGGIQPDNIRALVDATYAREIHFAALTTGDSLMAYRNPRCAMGATAAVPGEFERCATDPNLVAAFVRALADTD